MSQFSKKSPPFIDDSLTNRSTNKKFELDLPASRTSSNNSSTSNSSSSGSITHFFKRPENPSNDVSDTSPVTHSRNSRHGHRRSMSAGAPLIYSGSSFGSLTSNSMVNNSNVTTPVSNSKGLKTGLPSSSRAVMNKAEMSSRTGNYGHGSIMRGGNGGGCNRGNNGASDPDELKKVGNEMLGLRTGNYGLGSIIRSGNSGNCTRGSNVASDPDELKKGCNEMLGMRSGNYGLGSIMRSGNGGNCARGSIVASDPEELKKGGNEMLGVRSGNYGHGSIMRGGNGCNRANNVVSDPEELKKLGNEMYKKGNFVEALGLYAKAITLAPENAAYRSNKAAALIAIGKLGEAVKECEEAVKLDPCYARAHQRLASLYLRLGQAENARQHLCFFGEQQGSAELQKLLSLEKHISRCADARKIGDWKGALRESDAAITVGADSSPQLVACKAEAYLKLHQLEDADSTISIIPKFEHYPSQTKFCGMITEAYVLYVQAQIEMALGRFENAVSAAEKAGQIDYSNVDISMVLTNIKMVARARNHGNNLFSSGKYDEASSAYGEGLKYDASNAVLYCNRAVCWSKLGLWENSIEDCNHALKIQPNYTKALFRRAASNEKLGRWSEAIKDYQVLRKELPGDNEVVESLHNAETAMKRSQGVPSTKYGGEVDDVSSLDKFKAAISSPGVSIVHFKATSDEQTEDISPFINMLCVRYPSIHFLKVDVEESLAVAKAECIRTVPTFKIYKNGEKLKEIIRPSHQFLEDSVRSYSL